MKPWLVAILAVIAVILVVWLWRQSGTANSGALLSTPSGKDVPDTFFESDPLLREKLLDRINRNGDINDMTVPRPLVTLEEFFEGNNDYGSIGYNLTESISPSEFFGIFKSIRDRPDVTDVRVEVKDRENLEGWPSTDTIWIITTADLKEVESWFPMRCRPHDILDGFSAADVPGASPLEPYEIPANHRAVGIWWD